MRPLKQLVAAMLWILAFIPLNLFVMAAFLRQAITLKPGDRSNPPAGDDDGLIRQFVENNLRYIELRQGDEGLGTRYERLMVDRLLANLALRFGIRRALESPADGITGVPGANSLVLDGLLERPMTLTNPSLNLIRAAVKTWEGRKVAAIAAPVAALPFADRCFGLAWSFCMVEKLSRPVEYLRELARVSPGLVLVVAINRANLGNTLHRWYHRLSRSTWDHGREDLTCLSGLAEAFHRAGLEVLETGAVDVPPSIDTQDMPLKDDIQRVAGLFGRRWEWRLEGASVGRSKVLDYLCWLEDNLPGWFKMINAHHIYVLGRTARSQADAGC